MAVIVFRVERVSLETETANFVLKMNVESVTHRKNRKEVQRGKGKFKEKWGIPFTKHL